MYIYGADASQSINKHVLSFFTQEGVSINGGDTMVAVDPLYQMNMGQRTGLSFEDIKIINLAYCSG